ncbi:guanine nucleotide-binding protein G(o) subunit alpha-like [Amphiura filiformis]|uniref:guanine nucleotide-binding protein G(o) subunit alpha-like n=1 Tax=Amphiura filiformis TaxID=82378 RepID=UPI003B21882A
MGTGVSMALVGHKNGAISRSNGIQPVPCAVAQRHKEIEQKIIQDKMKRARTVRLLLLGAGESGKSTFAKQMRIIHHGSYDNMECMAYRDLVFSNVLCSMKNILQAMKTLNIPFYNESRREDAMLFNTQAKLVIEGYIDFSLELADAIYRLWKDPGLRMCYARSSEFQLIDSASYFFKSVHRIAEEHYLPTDDDIVRTRLVTTGVHETSFQFRNMNFILIDVGGQRTERRKWIHFFENVTAILFCIALSEYDQRLREDGVTNRMQESLDLFQKICSWKWFRKTPKILFLNKCDIFESKVKKVPISVFFKQYRGTSEVKEARQYICKQFVSKNKCKDSPVYHHYTTATDRSNVQFVFDAAMDVVLHQTLSDVGMIL